MTASAWQRSSAKAFTLAWERYSGSFIAIIASSADSTSDVGAVFWSATHHPGVAPRRRQNLFVVEGLAVLYSAV